VVDIRVEVDDPAFDRLVGKDQQRRRVEPKLILELGKDADD
jgi:hypothetical protein